MRYHETERGRELAERARAFMDEVVIPAERDHVGEGPVDEDLIRDLREQARERDVYAPQVDEEHGGLGADFRDVLPLFEEAGRSLLGAPAMRVDPPDEGNMHTLEMFGTDHQQETWLGPLVDGEIRSGISMTEPQPGAGSDPKMIQTQARKEGDEWVIDGHKWWTTQGSEADVLLVFARTDEMAHPYQGTSLFLVPTDADGVHIERDIPHLGPELVHVGHAEVRYEDVRVPEENLLGPEGGGFMVTQARLGPARLTHCMRYTGMAQRALDIAKAYMRQREAFGSKLEDKQAQRFSMADHETRLHAARTMVRHAAETIDDGEEARVEVSKAKIFCANVTQEAIDFAVQACGGAGMAHDLPLADFYASVRSFRIVDGADEVHKRVVARDAFEDVDETEIENLKSFAADGEGQAAEAEASKR